MSPKSQMSPEEQEYRSTPINAKSPLPDYAKRIEATLLLADVAPMLDDWARVRFDLQELARLRKRTWTA